MWEENGNVVAMLSFGNTADHDKAGAFEIWRIYITSDFQGKGIGHNLICVCRTSSERRRIYRSCNMAFKNNLNAISFYRKHGYILEKEEYLGKPYLTMGVRLNKKI